MNFNYNDYDEFEAELRKYCFDKCDQCGAFVEMSLEHIQVTIGDKYIDITDIPMLKCKNCSKFFYPTFTKNILLGLYNELCNQDKEGVISKPRNYQKQYNYATDTRFIYDHRDYESIPGLNYDEEHLEEGFLTPVYFDRKALIYFIGDPSYEVDIFSETYGTILKVDSQGVYEWNAPFGFNTNGKLIFWLGDLDGMDSFSRGILKSFNIQSDHLLVDSEFYQAQMNCIFSDPIKEKQIIINKDNFIKNINERYNIDLKNLQEECESQALRVSRPVIFNETNISIVINALDKILVEGMNVTELRRLYEQLAGVDSDEREHKKWQSIRLIKEILIIFNSKLKNPIDIEDLISPLYILHDYRIYLDHLLPIEKQEESKKHIAETLGVSSFEEQEKIYLEEIKKLDILFQYLVILSKE